MAKRIEIAGRFYRWRRGRLVEIPPGWVGYTVHPQTIRKRPSKLPRKLRKRAATPGERGGGLRWTAA